MRIITPTIVLLLAIQSTLCFGQDTLLYDAFPLIGGKVNYTRVFEVDSVKKNQLFTKIKDWAVNSYKSQKATLQAEDKEAGYIAYKGYLSTTLIYAGGILKGKPYKVDVHHTLKFYIKDGKVKIVFTDLETVSHDLGSEFVADPDGPEHIRIENWESKINQYSAKKQVKIRKYNKEVAKSINSQLANFLESLIKEIQKKQSEFDF